MELSTAILRQTAFCKIYEHYKCGIYVSNARKLKLLSHEIIKNLNTTMYCAEIKSYYNGTEIFFPVTGSYIKLVIANDGVRGRRLHGMIIDNDIDPRLTQTVILPYLVNMAQPGSHCIMKNDNPRKRTYHVEMKDEDILNLRLQYRDLHKEVDYMSSANLFNIDYSLYSTGTEVYSAARGITYPYYQQETNGKKIMVYKAYGVPKEKIEHTTEFINKTKEMYLIIKGEHEIFEDWSGEVNLRILIDTKIYDGYSVDIKDGLITVTLYEIKNEAPELKNYSEGK